MTKNFLILSVLLLTAWFGFNANKERSPERSGGNVAVSSNPSSPARDLPEKREAQDHQPPAGGLIQSSPALGVIGGDSTHPDAPFDNLFHLELKNEPLQAQSYILIYDLFGVTDHSGIARSINDAQATGSRFVVLNDSWSTQREHISVQQLRKGDNVIRFSIPENAQYRYKIRNLRLEIGKGAEEPLVMNQVKSAFFDSAGYIKGIIEEGGLLFCDGNLVEQHQGEFEVTVKKTPVQGKIDAELTAVLKNGRTLTQRIEFSRPENNFQAFIPERKGISNTDLYTPGNTLDLYLAGKHAGIQLSPDALKKKSEISVTALRDVDILPMNADLVNVTNYSKAYRFLPHGSHFASEAKLQLPFDSTLIPEGYTADDIRTYYFDETLHRWQPLRVDTILKNEGMVIASTTHFTDMINGIIKLPESPQTQGYTPTSIKEMKAADPSSSITMMAPPSASSNGSATVSFPLKLPAGRRGMQPQLALQYNNQGGNGWTGLGWNLSVPSIGIETRWGVPRYDAALETETYTLHGAQLAPVAFRGALIPRAANKTFTARVEGSFNRIIRHGNSPTNYWWETIAKEGTHQYYGGTPSGGVNDNAVLKDGNGNIGYWALAETRDANDNTVQYEYTNVSDPGIANGSVPGNQLYISCIYYTGHGNFQGAYRVDFIRDKDLGEPRRKDIEINASPGFKMVTADLLRKVIISFRNQTIRSYELFYKEGAFFKTLLNKVDELDAAGQLFYSHQMSYYNDVAPAQAFNPLGQSENFSPGNDNIKGDIINPIPGFTGEGSALSTTKSSSINGGMTLTVGSGYGGFWSKLLSVGGSFSYGEDVSEGLVSLLDINGDGLPDKIFKKGASLFYRRNLGNSVQPFGEIRPVRNASDFSYTRSKSISKGVQVVPLIAFFGNNNTTTTATTSVYFSDFNGDGLTDLASNGRVLFNHLNADGDPEFDVNSSLTPSPVVTGGSVDQAFFTQDLALQEQQEKDFPLHDIVRVWKAPFEGTVRITAPVKLLPPANQSGLASNKKDGVRVSIQVGAIEKWSAGIAKDDYAVKTPSGVADIKVTKDQQIYFRLESIYNGEDDQVEWDPLIEYVSPVITPVNADNRPLNSYQASKDFILDNQAYTRIGKDGEIAIDGILHKDITSDSVRLEVIREEGGAISILHSELFTAGSTVNKDIALNAVQVKTGQNIRFRLYSETHIDRSLLQWTPHFKYTAFTDNTPVLNSLGEPVIQQYVVPDNSNYNEWMIVSAPVYVPVRDTVKAIPYIKVSGNDTGNIVFSIKNINELNYKQGIYVETGLIRSAVDTFTLIRIPGEPLFIDYSVEKTSLAKTLSNPGLIILKDSFYLDNNGDTIRVIARDTLSAGIYTTPPVNYMGAFFRGWGQFAVKGNQVHQPLDETKLTIQQFQGFPTDPDDYEQQPQYELLQDPSKTDFVPLYANARTNTWVGYDTAVFAGSKTLASSRLWLHDVSVDMIMQGEAVNAVNKITKTETNSNSMGISFIISATEGKTKATTTSVLDMMDMNGDRYPDILNETGIQYSLPNGALSASMKPHPVGTTVNEGNSTGFSLGGGFPVAYTGKSTGSGAVGEQKQASASIGLSGNTGNGTDETISTWTDINGDGLPDKIYKDGRVALNLGYTFTAPENWGLTGIDNNSNRSQGAGLGVTLDAGSFQAGFGLSRGNGNSSSSLQDINGDGLPDKLTISGNGVTAQLNTGNGFAPAIAWENQSAISSNVNTGESINAAFTIVIPIPIPFFPLKICINPSFSTGHGVSRRLDQVMDLNGDGYPDILRSENDGNITAMYSTIGRTNLLQQVSRPMHGSFVIDYERTGNTYELPQSKWVLKSVKSTDGVKGDGPDTLISVFRYEAPNYNRHERDFYGFRKVITEQLDTEHGNAVYRRQVQVFENTSYYARGQLESEWLEDAGGNKFTQTNNLYELRTIQPNSEYPALVQTEKLFYEGQPDFGARSVTRFDYDAIGNVKKITDLGDGSPEDLIVADITYHNLDAPYIKSIAAGITVTTQEGIKRKRSTAIDSKGNIIRIQQFLQDGSSANTDFTFDGYGNTTRVTRPANYRDQRMWYAYEYDDEIQTYTIKVTDAFGYSSSSTYDYLFGFATSTISMQNEPMHFKFDEKGRLAAVTGPYEIAAGKPYTIAQEYHPEADVPYAVTRHYDPEYDSDIRIITFADGLARPIQVKKQTALFAGKGMEDDLKMIVSGRIIYDAFGRAVKTHFPVTEEIGSSTNNLSPVIGNLASSTKYDIADRQLENILADGAVTKMKYTAAGGLFNTRTTDALNNSRETFTDVRSRKRLTNVYGGQGGVITTRFSYNALSELLKVTDARGNATSYLYDNLGRKLSIDHPDAGITTFVYDLAGNLLEKTTAQLRKEIPNGGAIKYAYDYERLSDIDYPRYYQNKVKYVYGEPGKGERTGRLILTMDASGGQEFFYGKLGEVTKTIRTVLISPVYSVTYVSEQEYDTWNRIKTMTYADGEKLTYHYNRGGSLRGFDGEKSGNIYKYVDQLGYDEYEKRVYLGYGNGTDMSYEYEPLRRRLVSLKARTARDLEMMNKHYGYDAMDNILQIENDIKADSGKLGGYAKHDYDYDQLYRLVKAKGVYRGTAQQRNYELAMDYDDLYNITNKKMTDSLGNNSYDHAYKYDSPAPHQATTIGTETYSYDANGNFLGTANKENFWDEENRLIAVINNGILSRYTYDAEGERVVKSSGGIQGIWVNGAPAGSIKHYDNYTAYVSPYLVTRKDEFTKHFYIESQRVASKIGYGRFTNTSFPIPVLTAGGVDYGKRAEEIEHHMIGYYASQGVSPGPPTDKNFWARPENNGIAPPVFVDSTASSVPPGWPSNPNAPWYGQPITLPSAPARDSVKAGYGFDGTGHYFERDQYFYHPDHLGSTSYVTDMNGETNQHVEYSAFGETFFEEHMNSASTPYLFNAKEKDAETGFYYYGARYYDPKVSVWLSVDPETERAPELSPYNFCFQNPVKMVDPDGKFAVGLHYLITYTASMAAGNGHEKSADLAYYSSTYADGPSNFWIGANVAIYKNPDLIPNGRPTLQNESQKNDEVHNTWHCMRSDESQMTNQDAIKSGQNFAAEKMQSGTKENNIKDIGQAIHAVQDCHAHKGIANHEHVDFSRKNFTKSLKNSINDLGNPKDVIGAWKDTYKMLNKMNEQKEAGNTKAND